MTTTPKHKTKESSELITEIEQKYPLAKTIKNEQEEYINETSTYFLENIKDHKITVKEKLELTTTINNSLSLDIDRLYSVADRTVDEYEDISKDELSIVLLQLIATTNKNKLMRKIAKKLIKKVGKK
ncbi:hypothetical protein AB4027_05935 [Alkalibacterium putridalgicola]|uniref:hypothetical protein n=1 Tax=Alkalibacterium putridalgicola TaxID=426703 RepID=UPI0034CEEB76